LRRLEDIDPRFKYEISVKDGKEHVKLAAKKAVGLTIVRAIVKCRG
jgi:hypothetical protein